MDAAQRLILTRMAEQALQRDADKVNAVVKLYENDPVVVGIVRALGVMILTPGIITHLAKTDPQALKQARAAIALATGEWYCRTCGSTAQPITYSVEYGFQCPQCASKRAIDAPVTITKTKREEGEGPNR